MKKVLLFRSLSIIAVVSLCSFSILSPRMDQPAAIYSSLSDSTVNAGLTLPEGFTATVFAEGLGGARHLAVTKRGDVFVKLSRLKDGKGIYRLRDTNGDGRADDQTGFGNFPGTGIYIRNGYLYASSNDDVFRYKLNGREEVVSPDQPQRIITGLVNRQRDNSKALVVAPDGKVYVNVGSYSGGCLIEPGSLKAPRPCPLLDSVGGIWQFAPDKTDQHYSDGTRFATGLKNVVGMNWSNATRSIFAMHHGKDQLNELFPQIYTPEQATLVPAETMYELKKGIDGGWPYVYYDHFQHKKILSPEYGGDGKKTAGESAADPVAAFPAHLAPNGLAFYEGKSFPPKYRNGAFIAFHAKSAEIRKGYFVAFQPFKNGKPAGKWEVFADNFAGEGNLEAGKPAAHKPCGLAVGPDGALYVSDDAKGTIYKIVYHGK